MKRSAFALIISAALLISGCSSNTNNAPNSGVDLTKPTSEPGTLEAAAEFETAATLGGTSEPSADVKPPLLRMEMDLCYAAAKSRVDLTVGSYTWDEEAVSSSAHADPIALADCLPDVATINADEIVGNPRLILNGGEIISAVCCRDSSDIRPCEISDNEITLDSSCDIYCVTVGYEQGSCDYVFKTVAGEPPTLRLRVGNNYCALSRSNYQWSVTHGEETYDTIACGAAPWECRRNAPCIDLSGEVKGVLMLPDDAEIESICVYSADDSYEKPEFNGRTFDLPADPNNKVYSIDVTYPHGRCEYVFSTFTDGVPEDPADPESVEICGYPRYDSEIWGLPSYTETLEAPVEPDYPVVSAEPAQPAPYTHHEESHHGHHGIFWQKPANYISDCKLDNLSFYGYGFEVNVAENYERYYEGAITDKDVIAELWDIITKQELQPELTEGYSFKGTPYVEITDRSTGKVYTVSYTTSIIYGSCGGSCPDVEGHVCEIPDKYTSCMRISCGISTEYAATDSAKRFNELVMSSLKQYEPVRDAVFNKSAKTDWIVFVNRYTNYAWSPTDKGYFIDCYGNKYTFDFGGKRLGNNEDFFNELWQVYCDTNPVEYGLYDENSLFDILIDDVYAIDENAEESKSPSGGADMGQTSLYVVDVDGNLIRLRSHGDWNYCLEDDTAEKLCDFFDNERIS